MLPVTYKLLLQAEKYLAAHGKAKTTEFLVANGCDYQSASDILAGFGKEEGYPDRYLVQYLLHVPHEQKIKLIRMVKEFYDISQAHAQKLVDQMGELPILKEEPVLRILAKLKPSAKPDQSENRQYAVGFYQTRLMHFMTEGQEGECLELLQSELHMNYKEASEYLEDFRANLRRAD